MKRSECLHLLLAGLGALLLCGCLPEERVWWSPQGDRALVAVDGKLQLVGADGSLGVPIPELGSGVTVSWLPDGSGFVCNRDLSLVTWEEVRALASAEEVAKVEKLSPTVVPLLEAAAKLRDESPLPLKGKQIWEAALRHAYLQDPGRVESLLKALPDGGKMIESLTGQHAGFDLAELVLIKLEAGKAVAPVTLDRGLLSGALLPRVSPKHSAVAFLRFDDEEESVSLEVRALDGSASIAVASHVSAAFDWTPDGRSLVFMAPIGDKEDKLQSIHRITVLQESGALMKPRHEKESHGSLVEVKGPDRLPDAVTLATLLTVNQPALQVLADGRVLFSGSPITLPVAGANFEPESRLFVISADGRSVQTVPTAPGDLPADLAHFEASPDGKRVAVVEGGTDAVAVVEIDSGKTQIISPPHPQWQCRTMPAWKSATEVTFAALHGEGDQAKPAWMLWSEAGGLRLLSGKWHADATAGWLEKQNEKKKEEPVVSKPGPTR